MDMNVAGTMATPVMQGRVTIENGNVAYLDLPSALSDINGSLVFSQDRLQVEQLTAHVGGGAVTLSGYASAYQGRPSASTSAYMDKMSACATLPGSVPPLMWI